MSNYKPYNVIHINLAKDLLPPVLNTEAQGNYLVFWWNEFALGDLYLRPGQKLKEDEYYKMLSASISSCVGFYSTKSNREEAWQVWLQKKDFVPLAAWMNTIFFLPPTIPGKVPVSVIICTRNRAAYLQKCLTSLKKLHCLPEEIIVVDNARTDGSTEAVVQQFEKVKYVSEPRPGLDIARNTGIVNATMPIVSFVDDDVLVHPYLVYSVWQTFQNPDTAAMTGLVIASELLTESQYIFEKYWSFNRGYIDVLYDYSYYTKTLRKGPPVWKIGAGANMAFRRSVFEEVGYFDERLDAGAAGCNGDSEMWYRILAAGKTIHYNPRAIDHHEHRKEMKGFKSQIFSYMRGFAAAAMIQQVQNEKAGYRKLLFKGLPRYYLKLFRQGFPRFSMRYSSLWSEVRGVISGVNYYNKHKQPLNKVSK